MKNVSIIVGFLATACVIACSASPAFAQETPSGAGIAFNSSTTYVSKYVWRGMTPNPDPAVQQSLTISHPGGLSLNFWGSLDATDVSGNSNRFTEHDYTLSYSWVAGKTPLTLGYTYYAFPNTVFPGTAEIYTRVGLPGKLSPALCVYRDTDEAQGIYATLEAAYSLPLSLGADKAKSLDLAAKVGFASGKHNRFYCGNGKSALLDAVFGASIRFRLNSATSLVPAVTYSAVVDGSLRDSISHPDNLVTGFTLSADL